MIHCKSIKAQGQPFVGCCDVKGCCACTVLFRNEAAGRSEWMAEVHHTAKERQVEWSRMHQVLLQ